MKEIKDILAMALGVAIIVILAAISILMALSGPAQAQPCQQSESGRYCTTGTPDGAAPYWSSLCVAKWVWDEQWQGWWAYDYNPGHVECYPGGHWYWYGNP